MLKILKFFFYLICYIILTNIAPTIWKELIYPDTSGEFVDRLVFVFLLLTSVLISMPWFICKIRSISYKEAWNEIISNYKEIFTFRKKDKK